MLQRYENSRISATQNWVGLLGPQSNLHAQRCLQVLCSAPAFHFPLTFFDSPEGETEAKQVLACKKDCAKNLAPPTRTASFISATFFPAALRGNFPFLLQVFIAPMPKPSCICYNKIPVMSSKASSLLPTVDPLLHAAASENLSQRAIR